MAFCIIPELSAKLKEAARKGEINIEKMYLMDSGERRSLFEKYVDPETAKGVNTGFEKAMANEQRNAIANWVKNTFNSGEKQKPMYKDILSKINDLNEQGLLTPENEKSFLQDVVAEKLGATVTADEARLISEKSAHLQELQSKLTNIGSFEDNPKGQIEYFKARDEMNKYLQSLTPNSNLKVFTGTIGRGMMLATLHSPILNVESHTVMAFLATTERRILGRIFNGLSGDLVRKYMDFSNKVFDNSEYDLSRFEALGGEKKTMGEDMLHSEGKGIVRKTGQIMQQTVFKQLHGKLYQRFAAFHFADAVNLKATAFAKAEGLKGAFAKERADTIFKDATSLYPETREGQVIRAQAQSDALYATFTNKSIASETALQMRKVANTATGDYRLGDIQVPFAKIPANVLGAQLDSAGVALTAKTVMGIVKTFRGITNREPFDKENFAEVNKYFVRTGLGLTFAYAISTLIKPSNFIGAYPTSPTEQKLLDERNGVANSIKVGGKWVSLDYLGPLGASLLGLMYAKKFGGKTPLDYIYRYAQGVSQPLQNLPGLKEIAQAYKTLSTPPSAKNDVNTALTNQGKTILSTLSSRIIPGFISDFAKMTDPYVRAIDKTSVTSAIQQNIPGLRQGLPIKTDIFGDKKTTEPWLSTLLFGARVKNAQDSQLLNELVRLNGQNELPSITDVSQSSKSVQGLKTQISASKFAEAMQYFGKNLKSNMTDMINTDDYKTADSTLAQKKMLDTVKTQVLKDMLDTYGYEKPSKP